MSPALRASRCDTRRWRRSARALRCRAAAAARAIPLEAVGPPGRAPPPSRPFLSPGHNEVPAPRALRAAAGTFTVGYPCDDPPKGGDLPMDGAARAHSLGER